MDLKEIIKEHVAELDINWFQYKEAEFRRDKKYQNDREVIYIVETQSYPNYGEDEELLGYEVVEDSHEYTFKTYCTCHLPICEETNWGSSPIWYVDSVRGYVEEKSNNINEKAYDLVTELANFLKGEADVFVIHKFISKQLSYIEGEIMRQKKILDNKLYGEVLDEYLKLCTYKFHKRFEKQLIRYNETVSYEDSLKFELNQNELLSLLFIIQRAGFLTYPNHRELLEFCNNHFLYKNENGEPVRPTSLKALQKKYSDINASQAPKSKQDLFVTGLSTVSKKLADVIKKLR